MIVIFGCTARIRELTVNGMSEMGNLVKRKDLEASSPAPKGTEFARDPTCAMPSCGRRGAWEVVSIERN